MAVRVRIGRLAQTRGSGWDPLHDVRQTVELDGVYGVVAKRDDVAGLYLATRGNVPRPRRAGDDAARGRLARQPRAFDGVLPRARLPRVGDVARRSRRRERLDLGASTGTRPLPIRPWPSGAPRAIVSTPRGTLPWRRSPNDATTNSQPRSTPRHPPPRSPRPRRRTRRGGRTAPSSVPRPRRRPPARPTDPPPPSREGQTGCPAPPWRGAVRARRESAHRRAEGCRLKVPRGSRGDWRAGRARASRRRRRRRAPTRPATADRTRRRAPSTLSSATETRTPRGTYPSVRTRRNDRPRRRTATRAPRRGRGSAGRTRLRICERSASPVGCRTARRPGTRGSGWEG